jgi:hypothetical protein
MIDEIGDVDDDSAMLSTDVYNEISHKKPRAKTLH